MNGVVQVGAHCGEEVDGWLAEGRSPIICFEPQRTTPIHAPSPKVIWVRTALGDQEKLGTLRVPHHLTEAEGLDTQSASFLELIPERAIANGWTPTPVDLVEHIPIVRFDDWVLGWDFRLLDRFSLLKIDVQGMEMQVLKGFSYFLTSFKEIVVECSSPPLYKDGINGLDLEHFLYDRGFMRKQKIPRHGDVRFTRR